MVHDVHALCPKCQSDVESPHNRVFRYLYENVAVGFFDGHFVVEYQAECSNEGCGFKHEYVYIEE
jgi:hypothetical protein